MKLQFDIGASFSELKTAATQAKAELLSLVNTVKQAGQDVKIKVGLDISGINADIQNLKTTVRNALQGSATEKIKVKIEADAASIRADLAAIKPQIQNALGNFAPISLRINHAKLAQQLQAAEAQVRAAIARMTSPMALRISLNVDAMSTGLIAALNALKVEVNSLKQVMARGGGRGGLGGGSGGGLGGASSDVSGFASAMRDARSQLMQLVSTFGLLLGIKAFANITDEAKSLESKLKLVTSSQQELNQVTSALREIAKNNLQALAPTVELYSKLSSGTKNLEGANTALNMRLTDVVSKLVTISGSTGPAAEGAIIQFGQALSGNFSAAGQELNSIIEQAPALADAIAKSYGVTRGELKKLGEAGIITAAGVVNGLIRQGKEVDGLFGKINNTIGGTATTTAEALKKMIVDMDEAIGLSALMIDALVLIRDHTQELKLALGLLGAALVVAFGPAVVAAIAGVAASLGVKLVAALLRATLGVGALNVAITSLPGVFLALGAFLAGFAIGDYLRKEFGFIEYQGIKLAKNMHQLVTQIKSGFEELGIKIKFALTRPFDFVQLRLSNLIVWLSETVRKFVPFGDALADELLRLGVKVAPKGEAFDAYNKALEDVKNNTRKTIDEMEKGYDELADAAIKERNDKDKKETPKDEDLGTVAPKASKLKPTADENELNKDRLINELDNLEKRYGAEDIKLNAYFIKRKQLTEQLHDLEIKSIKDKYNAEVAAKTKAAKSKYDTDKELANKIKIESEKEKALKIADANYKAATTKTDADVKKEAEKNTAVGKAEIAKTQAVFTVNFEWKEAREQAKKKSEEMVAEFKLDAIKDKFDKTDAEIQAKKEKSLKEFTEQTLAGYEDQAEAARRIAEYEINLDKRTNEAIAKNNLDRIAEEIKLFTEQQSNKVKNTERLKDIEKISNVDAKLGAELINQQTLDGLAAYQERIRALNINDIPETKRLLNELAQKMAEVPVQATTNMDVFFANTNEKLKTTGVEALKSGLSDFFVDIATGAKSGSDAIKDFARGFAQSMARVAADALATLAIFQVLKAFGVPVEMVGGGISVGKKHTGGIAGGSGQTTTANPAWFLAAPRYHVGGIAGLQPGEVPAILQRGEEVLTQKDPRHVANGGGQGGGVRIINNIDPNMMHDYLSSSSGEQVIVNLIERNSGTIKQLLE